MTQKTQSDQTKQLVFEKYDNIGRSAPQSDEGCCGTAGSECETVDYEVFADDYSSLEGYNADADLGLGCGLPTEYAKINPGSTVLDLGSGAGNDCFVARQLTGDSGRVIGLDFAPSMIKRARENAERLGYGNVDFIRGDIEDNPLKDESVDIVVSNCVMNLVSDKKKAFSETYRVLKNGGHFSISDVVTMGDLPQQIREDAEMYAGCVAGAMDLNEYLLTVESAGFNNISIQKRKKIDLPDKLLFHVMTDEQIAEFRKSETGIYSVTVYAEK